MKLRPVLTLIGVLTVVGAILAAIIFYFAPLLLQDEDNLEKADAIVVLGGNYYRPLYAAELYSQGYGPKVLVSKPVVMPEEKAVRELGVNYPYQWEVFKEILLKKGVPEKDITFFGKANISTVEEAEELKKILRPEVRSIIVVTSPLHTRRAGTIFRDALPENIKVMVVSTPYHSVGDRWWSDFRAAPFVLLEVAKTIYYELGFAFLSTDQLHNSVK